MRSHEKIDESLMHNRAGRWRSTLVAIKVVEHSPGVSESMSLAEQKIEREALLATSLSHPNIIATFKICTMTAGELPNVVDKLTWWLSRVVPHGLL